MADGDTLEIDADNQDWDGFELDLEEGDEATIELSSGGASEKTLEMIQEAESSGEVSGDLNVVTEDTLEIDSGDFDSELDFDLLADDGGKIDITSSGSGDDGDVTFSGGDDDTTYVSAENFGAMSYQELDVTIDDDQEVDFDFNGSGDGTKTDAFFYSTNTDGADFSASGSGSDDSEFTGDFEFNDFELDNEVTGWQDSDHEDNVYEAFFFEGVVDDDNNGDRESQFAVMPHGDGQFEDIDESEFEDPGFGLVDLETGKHLQEGDGSDWAMGSKSLDGDDIQQIVEGDDLDLMGTGYWANQEVADA